MTINSKSYRSSIDNARSVDIGANRDNMNRLTTKTEQFSFTARGLPAKLLERIQQGETGYWQHQFDRLADREQPFYWNLGIANGRILYSGNRFWSVQMLLGVMRRFGLRTRSDALKSQLDSIESQIQSASFDPAQLLAMMKQAHIISEAQLSEALRIKILTDLDIYLLMGSGSARFIAADIDTRLPITGFSPIGLLDEAHQRQVQWEQLRHQVPSMKLCPTLDREAIEKAHLSDSQRLQIETLVQSGQSLNTISEEMAKDNLEVAKMFAKLASIGLVKFEPPQKHPPLSVMVIDDSPVLLAQFRHWVSALGYSVTICQDAKIALSVILSLKPAVIFIDINMPEISGFELVKQIRQHPDLHGIALAILTGEQKLSNKWRAQWSGCEFLNKPLTSGEISDFQVQLEELIPRLLAVSTTEN